jgi:hypothetical protein
VVKSRSQWAGYTTPRRKTVTKSGMWKKGPKTLKMKTKDDSYSNTFSFHILALMALLILLI